MNETSATKIIQLLERQNQLLERIWVTMRNAQDKPDPPVKYSYDQQEGRQTVP